MITMMMIMIESNWLIIFAFFFIMFCFRYYFLANFYTFACIVIKIDLFNSFDLFDSSRFLISSDVDLSF